MLPAVLPTLPAGWLPCELALHDRQLPRIYSDQVLLLEGTGNYTLIHFRNGSKKMASRTLLGFEKALANEPFFRIHKSYLINLREIERLEVKHESRVWLKNGLPVAVSRRRRRAFLECLRRFSMLP